MINQAGSQTSIIGGRIFIGLLFALSLGCSPGHSFFPNFEGLYGGESFTEVERFIQSIGSTLQLKQEIKQDLNWALYDAKNVCLNSKCFDISMEFLSGKLLALAVEPTNTQAQAYINTGLWDDQAAGYYAGEIYCKKIVLTQKVRVSCRTGSLQKDMDEWIRKKG